MTENVFIQNGLEELNNEKPEPINELKLSSDYIEALNVWLAYMQELKRNISETEKKAFIKEMFYDKFFAYKKHGKIVGIIATRQFSQDITIIRRFFINKEFRQSGLGTQLFSRAIQEAQKNKSKQVMLASVTSWESGCNFYRKIGMLEVPIEDLPENFPKAVTNDIFFKKILIY